jgi:hypothetical protein
MTKISNNGGTLRIVGIKTEQPGTVISTTAGGKTELLGGFVYPDVVVPTSEAAFVVNQAEASLIYALTSYQKPTTSAYANYQVQVEEAQSGTTKSLATSQCPPRGYGTMMPLYSSKR